jgi:ribosomal protein L30/L7E
MSQKASTDSFYTKSQVDNKVAIYYNPSTRGMVFPTDTSRVEYNPQTKGMIFH